LAALSVASKEGGNMAQQSPSRRIGSSGLLHWLWASQAIWIAACTPAAPPLLPGSLPLDAPAPQTVLRPAPLPPSATTTDAAELPHGVTPLAVLTELMTDPLLLDDAAGEYVELMLLSEHALLVADLRLRLPSGKVAVPERPDAPLLLPGEVLLLTAQGLQPGSARVKGLKLPNPAGRLELWYRDQLLDVAHWHNKKPWWKRRPGVAQERTALLLAGDDRRAWQPSRTVRRGQERGSPGQTQLTCKDLLATPWGQGSGKAQLLPSCERLMRVQVVKKVQPTRAALGMQRPERAPQQADWAPAAGRKPKRR